MRTIPTPALLALLVAAPLVQAKSLPEPTPEQQQVLQARWRAADTNGDGFIDRTEAQGLPPIAKRFDELDTDRDGRLSMQETLDSARNRLLAADANQDGFLDRAEVEASLPRLARVFDRVDTNQDGKLSPEEAQQFVARFNGRRRR